MFFKPAGCIPAAENGCEICFCGETEYQYTPGGMRRGGKRPAPGRKPPRAGKMKDMQWKSTEHWDLSCGQEGSSRGYVSRGDDRNPPESLPCDASRKPQRPGQSITGCRTGGGRPDTDLLVDMQGPELRIGRLSWACTAGRYGGLSVPAGGLFRTGNGSSRGRWECCRKSAGLCRTGRAGRRKVCYPHPSAGAVGASAGAAASSG